MSDMPLHTVTDARRNRRVLVFGDVHGRLDLLEKGLRDEGYDPRMGDLAVGLGDWMDRGPATLAEMNAFLDRHPEIRWVRGNHDDLLRCACRPVGAEGQDRAGNCCSSTADAGFSPISIQAPGCPMPPPPPSATDSTPRRWR